MAVYKGVDIADELSTYVRHMAQVDEYREALSALQAVWDNLTLLSEMSGTGIDIGSTRASFASLASRLIGSLAAELQRKRAIDIGFRAQVAVDILVRNLFERTADIGFLAMDRDFCAYAERASADADFAASARPSIVDRMREYVRKYSVYDDIVLLDPAGRVLARLDESQAVTLSQDPVVAAALHGRDAYVERYAMSDLAPGDGPRLVYAWRMLDETGGRAVGVLCLFFRLDNECARIFANLLTPRDWTVIALLDDANRVVASSDPVQLPPGVALNLDESRPLRFAGREYVAATRETVGYQGYHGPGWRGHAMVPVEHAYGDDDTNGDALPAALLSSLMSSARLFPAALREIPLQAGRIQAALNCAVWNGNLKRSRAASGESAAAPSFARTLLWEIGRVGARTRDLFSRSIRDLSATVVSGTLRDCEAQAALAVDIMDRNLYERANDCRWWALTSLFRTTLAIDQHSTTDIDRLCEVLAAINSLYTVYTDLLLFDRSGKVMAVSNAARRGLIGRRLDGDWVRRTLDLRNPQQYCVSAFERSGLYDERHTYVYCAAVRHPQGRDNVGGIAIVFDSEPQFRAMLEDALPRDARGADGCGALGLFVTPDGIVLASSDGSCAPGTRLEMWPGLSELQPGASSSRIVQWRGLPHALGARMSSGYREYKSAEDSYHNPVLSLVLVPLSTADDTGINAEAAEETPAYSWPAGSPGEAVMDIACFRLGKTTYALPTCCIEDARPLGERVPLPGARSPIAGLTEWRGQSLPVFDLVELRDGQCSARTDAQLVVVRPAESQPPFGLLVDALGDIPTIARDKVLPVPFVGSGVAAYVDGLLAPPVTAGPEAAPVLLLGIDKLLAQLNAAAEVNAVA